MIGFQPDEIIPADIDETPLKKELPKDYVLRVAQEKAAHIAKAKPGCVVLASDTTVACGRTIMQKAESPDEARAFLTQLSGRRHRVLTSVVVINAEGKMQGRVAETIVRFKRLHESEMEAYITSGEWEGKAGGYGIQGLASAFIPWISGTHFTVMGLPLVETRHLLMQAGIRPTSGA